MNARTYRINIAPSQLDFPPIVGLGQQTDMTQMEVPLIVDNKLSLKITKSLLLTDSYSKKEYEVLKVQSSYEIPVNSINTPEDIYEFFKDATSGLREAYEFVQKHRPQLPNFTFPVQPLEVYKTEIGGVLYLLGSLN